jgi:predicted nucleotide-binding protein (sugar kinase/HSP70/actin superfamily)
VALLDLSSFKCGHDAPTYGIVDSIVTAAATPYAALHDIDANKPGGSIKIRVKTYAHSLKLHQEALEDATKKRAELTRSLDKKKLELLSLKRERMAVRDPELERQIAELAERVRSYTPPPTPEPVRPAGLYGLKKKQADGTLVPVSGG